MLRLEKGWSQEQLAERAGLSYKFVGEVERGVGNPSVETLFEIATALGVEPVAFFQSRAATMDPFRPGVSEERLYSAREALESLEDLLKELAAPLRRRPARRAKKRRSR
jgi:transcriptional regulator with XRE-family HTH domain